MNRWLAALGSVAIVATAVTVGSLVAPAVVPQDEVAKVATRTTMLCPAFESATATRTVAAASTVAQLRLTTLSSQENPRSGEGLVTVTGPTEPIRVSAERSGASGASTVVAASDGSDRGLSVARCLLPQPEYWFTGVEVSDASGSEIDLINLDGTRAVVDLTAYGPSGRLAASRGLVVDPNSEKKVSLALIQRGDEPISLRVTSSEGRVAAFLRQRAWGAARPLGADWLSASVDPATDLIVPGVPDGAGRRTLVIGNPGDRTAMVKVDVLGDSGPSNVVGADTVEVLAGTSRAVDLAAGLGGAVSGGQLTSEQPVTAGLLADSGGSEDEIDPAGVGASPALPADSIWPMGLARSATAVVAFTNPDLAGVTAIVSTGGAETTVRIPARSTATYTVPKSAGYSIRIKTESSSLRAAVVARQSLGTVKGLAVMALVQGQSRTESVQVGFDPHLGS